MFGQMWVVLNEIDLAIKRLPQWMKDEDRSEDAVWSFKTVCMLLRLEMLLRLWD